MLESIYVFFIEQQHNLSSSLLLSSVVQRILIVTQLLCGSSNIIDKDALLLHRVFSTAKPTHQNHNFAVQCSRYTLASDQPHAEASEGPVLAIKANKVHSADCGNAW